VRAQAPSQRTLNGQSQAKIADEFHPIVENILNELDRWLHGSEPPTTTMRASRATTTLPRPSEEKVPT